MIDLVLNTSPVGQSRRDIQTKPERKRPVMNRPIALLVPALAIAIAACSSTASPSAAPTDVSMPSVAPTTAPSDSAAPCASPAAMGKDIVETATEAKSFSTLLTAATAAGLVETLQGKVPTPCSRRPISLAALPAGTLEGLLADKEALKAVLLYHVVSGAVTADQVVGLTSADSVEGSPIDIAVKDGMVYLNDSAKVVTPT